MDFIQVVHALKMIKKHCQETKVCKHCRLHTKYDKSTCGVSSTSIIPANWEFDLESEITVPSIFK